MGMQERIRIGLLVLLLFSTGISFLQAAPMDGKSIEYTQPGGTVIHLQVFGDEYYAETRTLDGYTVVFNPETKAYYYANLSTNGDDFVSSGILVGTGKPPADLPKKLTIKTASKRKKARNRRAADESEVERAKRWNAIKQKTRNHRSRDRETSATNEDMSAQTAGEGAPALTGGDIVSAPPSSETTGLRIGLTILVEFPDEAGTIARQEVDDYCNKPGYTGFGNDGSIYDYFLTQSDGKLRYYNVVTPYVMAPHPKAYYNDTSKSSGTCGRLLLNDVLQVLLDQGFDFSHCTVNASGRLHAINMFFTGKNSGVWSKGLWPHKSGLSPDVDLGGGIYADQYQTSNMGASLKIGTFCHENGHLLCSFPDFYDYDYDSRGVGRYSLMASSGYSDHPTSVDGYLRYHAGWVETIPIDTFSHMRGSVRVDAGSLFRFENSGNTAEYFLIDNRQKIGWESGANLPDQGLFVMHCDEDGNHNYQEMSETNHFEVSIEQADGLFQLEYDINSGGSGDLFHSGDKTEFSDSTLPNAHWWANATTNPVSGDASGLDIHDIGVNGETMTFIVGSGALGGAASVGVDRALLEPSAFFGESPPDNKIAVWNQGGGTLFYTVSSPTPWISLSTPSGNATTESDLVTISYSTAALASGVHAGQIAVTNSANTADVRTISVQLTIESAPSLSVTPASLSVTGAVDSIAAAPLLMIDNAGGGSLSYTISGPVWLSASITNGTVSGEVDALESGFDATGLTEGEYTGTLTVAAPGAANAPWEIPLSFYITDIVLLAPTTGIYTNGETVSIEWASNSNAYPLVDIELWRDGRQKVVIADDTPNDGQFLWTVPPVLPSGSNYIIRISCEGSASFKESDSIVVWQYRTSFETGFEGWVNREDDDFDWIRRTGKTPSSDTGPAGASQGNYYLYTESSSPNYSYKEAVISNHFDLGASTDIGLAFDFHMYGAKMGDLHLDLFDGSSWHPDIWTASGQQHELDTTPWTTIMVDLSPYLAGGTFDLRFRGVTATSWTSDMAIDDIRLADYTESVLTNGVPASWLDGFGLPMNDAAALLDSDADGIPNWAEYIAGTSPIDSGSLLELTHVEEGADGLVIQWSAVYGKTYSIIGKPDLVFSDWQTEENGIPGVEPLCTHTVVTDNTTGFIKIEVEQ